MLALFGPSHTYGRNWFDYFANPVATNQRQSRRGLCQAQVWSAWRRSTRTLKKQLKKLEKILLKIFWKIIWLNSAVCDRLCWIHCYSLLLLMLLIYFTYIYHCWKNWKKHRKTPQKSLKNTKIVLDSHSSEIRGFLIFYNFSNNVLTSIWSMKTKETFCLL